MNTTTAPAPVRTPAPLPRVLLCYTCDNWTPHALNASGTHYVCACGTQIVYHVNRAPATEAIQL